MTAAAVGSEPFVSYGHFTESFCNSSTSLRVVTPTARWWRELSHEQYITTLPTTAHSWHLTRHALDQAGVSDMRLTRDTCGPNEIIGSLQRINWNATNLPVIYTVVWVTGHVDSKTFQIPLSQTLRIPDGSRTPRPQDTSPPRHFGTTKLVPKFKPNHRWSCVSSELSWVEVSRLFLDHGTRVEVSCTTFFVLKCLETGAEVSQSVL